MSDLATPPSGEEGVGVTVDEALAHELVERVRSEGVELVGPVGEAWRPTLSGRSSGIVVHLWGVYSVPHLGRFDAGDSAGTRASPYI